VATGKKKTAVKGSAKKASAKSAKPSAKSAVKPKIKAKAKPSAKKPAKATSKKAAPKASGKKAVARKAAGKPRAKTAAKAKIKSSGKSSVKPSKASESSFSKMIAQSAKKPAAVAAKKTAPKDLDLSDFVTPLDDRLIVLRKETDVMTPGGLYIPDTVSDRGGNAEGMVVSVGRGHRSPKGHIRPMDVKVGDKILFAKHSGAEIKIQDYDLLIVREADVLGVVG
jgi:chaperonin GroES